MQPTKVDLEALRAEWAAQGYTFAIRVAPPGEVWHDFVHDVDETVLLLEGESLVELPGRTLRMHTGDELQIPAGTRHTVRNVARGPARWAHGFRDAPPPAR